MSIVLEGLTKKYGGQFVVDHVSLDVADGELFVLLGSSGSGKTTVLRMIAGLSEPDEGRIVLHGRDVTLLPAQDRGVGVVFQNYSLFRHMTVAENIEFGLRIRKVGAADRAERRDALLDLVGLSGLGSRFSHQLSGGQQQRVALARALAYEPSVLLLDEPFGALDVKTRVQLRRSLKEIQQRLRVTAVLVTHDQEEAFELADRIGVIDRGRVLEVGPPEELYLKPRTLFVSTFLGAGTVIVGRAEEKNARFGPLSVPIPPEIPHEEGSRVQLLFRPEQVAVSESEPPRGSSVVGRGQIIEQNFTGAYRRVRLRLPHLEGTRQIAPPVPFGEEGFLVDAIVPTQAPLSGEGLWVSLNNWHMLQQPPMNLLVLDTGSDSDPILQTARVMAEGLRATVTILGIAENKKEIEKVRTELVQRRDQAGLTGARVHVRTSNLAEEIAAEQAASTYDLVLLASRSDRADEAAKGRRTRGRGKEGVGLVSRILDKARLPVLVIKRARTEFARILICTAAGEPGKFDVNLGGRLARRLGAAATVLHVIREDGDLGVLAAAHLDHAAAALRALDVPAEVRAVKARNPSLGIIEQSRSADYGLIVIGSRGRSSKLTRSASAIGDIAIGLVNAVESPVLVVPFDSGL